MSPARTKTVENEPGTVTRHEGLDLALLLGTALALRLIPLAFGVESTDIGLYREQALPVLRGENVYAATEGVFPYTPVSMFFPALCLAASALLGVPFHVVIKLFPILADVGIVLLLRNREAGLLPPGRTARAALLFAVSPVSILVSSFHGNNMSFVVLLMLSAYVLFRADPERNLTAAGLVLGLAIGWRSFPVLLLPFFLSSLRGAARRAWFAAVAVVPTTLSLVPFALVDASSMLEEILGYSGIGIHHGPFGVARGLYLLSIESLSWETPAGWAAWMAGSKLAFLALYAIAALHAKKVGLLNGALVTFGLFYLVYCGVASQYLVWVVPFLLLKESRVFSWSYELAAAFALVTFYWIFFPEILFGRFLPHVPLLESAPLLRQYVLAELLLSAVCAIGVAAFASGRGAAGRERPLPLESRRSGATPRIVSAFVCAFFLLLYAWEIAFVARL